jgi:IS605 OrfB family transposase
MQRSIKISLSLATATKHRRVVALLREVRGCIQRYIDFLWTETGKLDATTLNSIAGGSLSYRHRSNCLKIALETIHTTRKAADVTRTIPSRPRAIGAICLSSLVAKIKPGKGSFDYVLKISSLISGKPIIIPFRGHKRLNYWLGKTGAKLLQGCTLGDNWAAIWIKIPEQCTKSGITLGIDIGINKLIVDSNNNRYGTEIKKICARVRRCKPGSNGRFQASMARKNYINREIKKLPWHALGIIGIEKLKNLKLGKKPGQGKVFRKAIAPWTYRQVIKQIEMLAQENRVLVVSVDPRNTSRTCPNCGTVAKESRRGENFLCVNCGHNADADFVGAQNVLARTHPNSRQSMVVECFADIG